MSFENKVIAITGKLSLPRKSIVEIIENNGGTFSASVSKKVTHLICANPSESSTKLDKARNMGVVVVGEDFLTNVDSSKTVDKPTETQKNKETTETQKTKKRNEKKEETMKRNEKKEETSSKPTKKQKKKESDAIITTPISLVDSSEEGQDSVVKEFETFIALMLESNSNLDKQAVFKKFIDDASDDFIHTLKLIYHKQLKFGITSKNIVKFEDTKWSHASDYVKMKLSDFADQLVGGDISGHNALKVAVSFLHDNPESRETLLLIFNKDLKLRFGLNLVNKTIPDFVPVFNVSLGYSYDDKTKKHVEDGEWFISKKLDGVRCISMIHINLSPEREVNEVSGINVEFYSRGGLQFKTLSKVEAEIKALIFRVLPTLLPLKELDEEGNECIKFVLDGEMCIIDENGNEDFRSIVSAIKTKDNTVENPRYLVFDMLTYKEFKDEKSLRMFSERLDIMKQLFPSYQTDIRNYKEEQQITKDAADGDADGDADGEIVKLLPQLPFTEEMFAVMSNQAEKQGWEGLMIRKDAPYSGKRSNDLLKVKQFETEEYEVQDVVFGDVMIINEDTGLQENIATIVSVVINHKGLNTKTNEMDTKVINVGSGFSQEQRKRFYATPNLIKGKVISVQFFEKIRSRDGKESLRFPTFKGLYGSKRVL
jgi:DNA ligase-1